MERSKKVIAATTFIPSLLPLTGVIRLSFISECANICQMLLFVYPLFAEDMKEYPIMPG